MEKIRHIIIYGACYLLGTELSIGQDNGQRGRIVREAHAQLEVREETGKNDGAEVEKYLRYVGLPQGYAWCSAFVCWCYGQAGAKNPRNAMANSWFRSEKIIYDRRYPERTKPIRQADAFGIWFADKGRIAHVGIILLWTGQWVVTIEGNTSDANTGEATREGQGVYKKKRLRKQVYQVANWIE